MSKVKIAGHASGSGTLTIQAPDTSSSRTITLPDSTGTILDENSSLPAANLTGTVADARLSTTGVTAGVLKENLLTNSGFDVWSNSTLENVGSELVTNGTAWTGATGATKPNDWTQHIAATWTIDSSGGSGAEPALKVEHNGTNNNPAMHQIVTTVVGKLYKMSVKVKKGTASYAWLRLGTAVQGSQYTYWANNSGSWDTLEYVFEATTTTTYLSFEATTSTTGQYSHIDTASIYEVTPGCVANDDKAFDGWLKKAATDVHREHTGSNTKDGSFYSLKVTGGSNTDFDVNWYVTNPNISERFVLRTITMGCWVKAGAASEVKIAVYDGSWNYSSQNTTTGWEWLEYSKTLSDNGSYRFGFEVDDGEVVYISQPMLVFGSSIGEGNYTRPQGEIVWFDKDKVLNSFNEVTVSSDTSIYLEQESDGIIPKGTQAAYTRIRGECATVEKRAFLNDGGGSHGLELFSQVADIRSAHAGWVKCGTLGTTSEDIKVWRNDTFNLVEIAVGGVQLK